MRPPPKRTQPGRVQPPPPLVVTPSPPSPTPNTVYEQGRRVSEGAPSGHVDVALEECVLKRDGDNAGQFSGVLRITNLTGRTLRLVAIRVEFIVNSMEVGSLAEDANMVAAGQDRRWPFSTKLLTWFKESQPPFGWNALVLSEDIHIPVRMTGVSWAPQSNCYVVTACAGDPDDAVVRVFREFRDCCLTRSRLGRAFISWYELIGPRCARLIRRYSWLRKASHRALVGLVPVTKTFLRRAESRRNRECNARRTYPGIRPDRPTKTA